MIEKMKRKFEAQPWAVRGALITLLAVFAVLVIFSAFGAVTLAVIMAIMRCNC